MELTGAVAAVDLRRVGAAFGFGGELLAGGPHGAGHIHDSFAARFSRGPGDGAALFQRLNQRVFPEPQLLMENIVRVTAHLRRALAGDGDAHRRALEVLPARDGGVLWPDGEGGLWRAFRFIAGAHSREQLADAQQARQAARAFALFQRALADLPPPRLHDTLPRFHDTPGRLAALTAAAARDPHGRAAAAAPELEFARRHEALADALHREWRAATAAGRVTHNDTKLNNLLLDDVTGEPLCVVDLDTVMPGLPLHDFGDLARFALLSAEDERDLARIQASEPIFAALARGWIEGLGPDLGAGETSGLVTAAQVMTFECGVRFLTDFLAGDGYFKTHRPGQNLDRARAHFALVESLQRDELLLQRSAGRR